MEALADIGFVILVFSFIWNLWGWLSPHPTSRDEEDFGPECPKEGMKSLVVAEFFTHHGGHGVLAGGPAGGERHGHAALPDLGALPSGSSCEGLISVGSRVAHNPWTDSLRAMVQRRRLCWRHRIVLNVATFRDIDTERFATEVVSCTPCRRRRQG